MSDGTTPPPRLIASSLADLTGQWSRIAVMTFDRDGHRDWMLDIPKTDYKRRWLLMERGEIATIHEHRRRSNGTDDVWLLAATVPAKLRERYIVMPPEFRR